MDFNFLAYIGRSQKLLIFGGTSIYAQFVPNFGQVTLEAMSESGQKGKLIRQLDQNSGHSNDKVLFKTEISLFYGVVQSFKTRRFKIPI